VLFSCDRLPTSPGKSTVFPGKFPYQLRFARKPLSCNEQGKKIFSREKLKSDIWEQNRRLLVCHVLMYRRFPKWVAIDLVFAANDCGFASQVFLQVFAAN
jgi:hypothetical protein